MADEQRITRAQQVKVYFGKCWRIYRNERQWKNLISTFIIICLVCVVTSPDMFRSYSETKTGIFAVNCACLWVGLFNSIQSICRERAIIKREYRTGLHISSYIAAHVLFEAIICLTEAVIILVVVLIRNHSHLPEKGLAVSLVTDMLFSLFLVTFASDMIAILVSSIVKDENTAMTVMPFVLVVQLVMSGAIFELNDFTQLVSYCTISRWGQFALSAIAQTDTAVDLQAQWSEADNTLATSDAGHLLLYWGLLLSFSLLYIVLSILFLKRVDKDQR